jgi:hypothetical protein
LNFTVLNLLFLKFHDYQGKQRSNAEMANILINGGKKNITQEKGRIQRKTEKIEKKKT